MDDVPDEAGASLSQSFGMDKADIFFGRTLKLTLGWKIRSHRSENGKKIMGENPQSLENHGFPQISQFEKVPIFEPGNSGFKNGNLSFILGSRKELRFVLNRSFHVQLSMRSVTVVKFDILF